MNKKNNYTIIEAPVDLNKELEETNRQILAYAEDINRIYHLEYERRRELELNNKKLSAIINNLADGLIVTDRDEIIQTVNPKICELFNLTEEHCKGKDFASLIKSEKLSESLKTVSKEKKPLYNIVTNINIPFERFFSISITPVTGKNKNINSIVILFHDITTENRVKQMKEEFISIVSHEIRTPASVIKGYVELLLSELPGGLNGQQKEFLSKILVDNKLLINRVTELLEISEIKTAHLEIFSEPVNAVQIIRAMVFFKKAECMSKGIEISYKFPSEKIEIYTDKNRLSKVIEHLISNAISFTHRGGKINISYEKSEDNHIFHITDTGIGIHKSEIPKIFDKFYQIEDPLCREIGGLGLGLSIVKYTLSVLKGNIYIESEPGKGSKFSISIPDLRGESVS
jgi:two-component system phosphate regulon sensor histidine kinase PhoR